MDGAIKWQDLDQHRWGYGECPRDELNQILNLVLLTDLQLL